MAVGNELQVLVGDVGVGEFDCEGTKVQARVSTSRDHVSKRRIDPLPKLMRGATLFHPPVKVPLPLYVCVGLVRVWCIGDGKSSRLFCAALLVLVVFMVSLFLDDQKWEPE